ncbi:MAG: HypC/HybG/HupF family hydrogenase formation chaperone [Patescibacteria group bacterium]
MCFGIPCKIEKVNKNKATVKNGGEIFDIDTSLLPKIKKDDWILVQGNIGMRQISEEEATGCLAVLDEFQNKEGKGGA